MAIPVTGQVGPVVVGDGVTTSPLRQGRFGELIASELQGRFYEQNYRGNTYSAGMGLTSISNATFTSATLGATATPIIGVWNPANSGVNLVVLQAILSVVMTAATSTGPGGFVWAFSVGNSAPITTALVAWNRKTLLQTGGQGKNVTGVALTGLVAANNLVVVGGSALLGGSSGNFSFVGTAAGDATTQSGTSVENLDGSIIVPPTGILALLATTTPVAHSASSMILWNEMPTA